MYDVMKSTRKTRESPISFVENLDEITEIIKIFDDQLISNVRKYTELSQTCFGNLFGFVNHTMISSYESDGEKMNKISGWLVLGSYVDTLHIVNDYLRLFHKKLTLPSFIRVLYFATKIHKEMNKKVYYVKKSKNAKKS